MNLDNKKVLLAKITLVEFAGHHEVIDSIIDILLTLNCDVNVVTNRFNRTCSDYSFNDRVKWVICKREEFKAEMISDSSDRIIVISPVLFISDDRVSYIIHNSANLFKLKHLLKRSIKGSIRSLLNKDFILDRIIESGNEIIVPSITIDNYLRSLVISEGDRTALELCIPFLENDKGDRRSYSIVVPGKIDIGRRDYDMFIKGLLLLKEKELLEVTFLGNFNKGQERFKLMNLIKDAHPIKFYWYNEYVPQATYNEVMMNSDLVVAPLKKSKTYNSFVELWSLTCISGAINSAIRHSKMVLVPSFYLTAPGLEFLAYKYSDETELSDVITAKRNEKSNGIAKLDNYRTATLKNWNKWITK